MNSLIETDRETQQAERVVGDTIVVGTSVAVNAQTACGSNAARTQVPLVSTRLDDTDARRSNAR